MKGLAGVSIKSYFSALLACHSPDEFDQHFQPILFFSLILGNIFWELWNRTRAVGFRSNYADHFAMLPPFKSHFEDKDSWTLTHKC